MLWTGPRWYKEQVLDGDQDHDPALGTLFSSTIFVACPDQGASNGPEALELIHSPLEGLK